MISWSTSDIAGIHLGDSHVSAVRILLKGQKVPTITHAGWEPYDSGAAEKDIAGVVRGLWKSLRMPTRMVSSSLRSSSMVMRYFKIPVMSDRDLKSALALMAEEALQLPKAKLSVDWHIEVRPPKKETGNVMVEGLLAAAPIKDVERQLTILSLAGLDPVIVDIRAMAVANLFQALDDRAGESAVCLVNMAPHSADVVVMRKLGGVYPYTVFCRASTWGQSPGFLAENIRDVLKYSEFKLDWDGVKRVVLTGEVPENGDFLESLRTELRLPVEVWNPINDMAVQSQGVKDQLAKNPVDAAKLVPALGLALRRG